MLDGSKPVGRAGDPASIRLDCYVGDNIKRARVRQCMSLVDLGHAIGVQESSIANYEAGLEKVGSTVLYKIAVTLDVTLASLFGMPQH